MDKIGRREQVAQRLRVAFAKRYEAHEPGMFMQSSHPGFYALADWILSLSENEPGDTIARLLDGFFRDGWAKSKHFPIKALANCPQNYFEREEKPREVSPEMQRLIASRQARESRNGA